MIRRHLMERSASRAPRDEAFRWRGKDVSRLECFSDAAFGFALTLLVVSQQVPQTFDQLLAVLRGFPTFVVCFLMLSNIWYKQYIFCRHYGLQDVLTIRLNLVLLIMVLYAVYPLKFLFTLGMAMTFNIAPPEGLHVLIKLHQLPTLMAVYGLGLAAVFGIFALLYAHAYRLREELELTPLECFDTRARILSNAFITAVALASVAISADGNPRHSFYASMVYVLIIVMRIVEWKVVRSRRRALQVRLYASPPLTQPDSERAEQPVSEVAKSGQDIAAVV